MPKDAHRRTHDYTNTILELYLGDTSQHAFIFASTPPNACAQTDLQGLSLEQYKHEHEALRPPSKELLRAFS
jgi:hypothetical protein